MYTMTTIGSASNIVCRCLSGIYISKRSSMLRYTAEITSTISSKNMPTFLIHPIFIKRFITCFSPYAGADPIRA